MSDSALSSSIGAVSGNLRIVGASPRRAYVLELVDATLQAVAALPKSDETEALAQEAESLREAVHWWRRSPPSLATQSAVMDRALALHKATTERTAAEASTEPPASSMRDRKASAFGEEERPTAPPDFDLIALARTMTAPEAQEEGPPASATVPKRTFSPSSLERAVLGAIEESPGPVLTSRTIEDPVAEMFQCVADGDYAGALDLADLILTEKPESLIALQCREQCRTALESLYTQGARAFGRVPVVVAPPGHTACLSLNHRAGFLLSLIDGKTSVEAILDVCSMPPLEALAILDDLVKRGVVVMR